MSKYGQSIGPGDIKFTSMTQNPKKFGIEDPAAQQQYLSAYGNRPQNQTSKIFKQYDEHQNQFPIEDLQITGENYKDIFNQHDYYKKYNEKLQRQFQETLQGKGLSIYQKGLIQADKVSEGLDQLLVSSEHINPLLKALDEENKILKQETSYLSEDLRKFILMVEMLLHENNFIREHINQKNRDLKKLMETIGLNDGQEIYDLKNKIHILTEENNILIRHLDEMKKFKEEYNNFAYQNDIEMEKAKEIYVKAKEDLDTALKREEALSKQLSILEPKYKDGTDVIANLENELEIMKNQQNSNKNEISQLKAELTHYKRNYEELNQTKSQENDQLVQQNYVFQNEKKDLKSHLQQRERELEQVREENKKILKDLQTLSSSQEELNRIKEQYTSEVQVQKTRVENSLQREKQTQENLNLALHEVEKVNIKLQQIEKHYNALLDSSKLELQDKHNKYERIIEQLKIKQREILNDKEEEVQSTQKTFLEQKKTVDKLQQDLDLKSRDSSELKNKLSDYQHQKRIIDAQALELRQLQNEITELNNLLNEYKQQLLQANDSKQIEELSHQVSLWQEKYHQLQLETVEGGLKEEKERLDIEVQDQKLQIDHLNQQLQEQKQEIGGLRDENHKLVSRNLDSRMIKQTSIMEANEQFAQSTEKIRSLFDENRRLEDNNNQLKQQLMQISSGQKIVSVPITSGTSQKLQNQGPSALYSYTAGLQQEFSGQGASQNKDSSLEKKTGGGLIRFLSQQSKEGNK